MGKAVEARRGAGRRLTLRSCCSHYVSIKNQIVYFKGIGYLRVDTNQIRAINSPDIVNLCPGQLTTHVPAL